MNGAGALPGGCVAVMRLKGKWEVAALIINKSIWNLNNYCSSCGIVIWSSEKLEGLHCFCSFPGLGEVCVSFY